MAVRPTIDQLDALPRWLRDRIEVTPAGCWRWTGSTVARTGAGQVAERRAGNPTFGVGSRTKVVHRLVWELLVGELAAGEVLAQGEGCTEASCSRPSHREVVHQPTHWRATLLSVERGGTRTVATECKRGHPLPPLAERVGGCRACTRVIAFTRAHGLPHPDVSGITDPLAYGLPRR